MANRLTGDEVAVILPRESAHILNAFIASRTAANKTHKFTLSEQGLQAFRDYIAGYADACTAVHREVHDDDRA